MQLTDIFALLKSQSPKRRFQGYSNLLEKFRTSSCFIVSHHENEAIIATTSLDIVDESKPLTFLALNVLACALSGLWLQNEDAGTISPTDLNVMMDIIIDKYMNSTDKNYVRISLFLISRQKIYLELISARCDKILKVIYTHLTVVNPTSETQDIMVLRGFAIKALSNIMCTAELRSCLNSYEWAVQLFLLLAQENDMMSSEVIKTEFGPAFISTASVQLLKLLECTDVERVSKSISADTIAGLMKTKLRYWLPHI